LTLLLCLTVHSYAAGIIAAGKIVSGLSQQFRQLRNIRRNPPRLIARGISAHHLT
jgi:hypothetical protein